MGRQWFDLADTDVGPAAAGEIIEQSVALAIGELGLGMEAVALTGFSQGGMMSLHCGLRMRARATKEEFASIAEDRLRLESESESLQLEKMRLRDQVREERAVPALHIIRVGTCLACSRRRPQESGLRWRKSASLQRVAVSLSGQLPINCTI